MIYSMKTRKMVFSGCNRYLTYVVDNDKTKGGKLQLEDIPVVRYFIQVFPQELPRLP